MVQNFFPRLKQTLRLEPMQHANSHTYRPGDPSQPSSDGKFYTWPLQFQSPIIPTSLNSTLASPQHHLCLQSCKALPGVLVNGASSKSS